MVPTAAPVPRAVFCALQVNSILKGLFLCHMLTSTNVSFALRAGIVAALGQILVLNARVVNSMQTRALHLFQRVLCANQENGVFPLLHHAPHAFQDASLLIIKHQDLAMTLHMTVLCEMPENLVVQVVPLVPIVRQENIYRIHQTRKKIMMKLVIV